MDDLKKLGFELADLRKSKRFEEMIELFEKRTASLEGVDVGSNPYIVSDMITAYRKTGRIDEALRWMSEWGVAIDEKTPERILSAYGWLLYGLYKQRSQNNRLDKHAFFSQVSDFLPLLVRYDSPYVSSLISRLFRMVVSHEKKKASIDWAFLEAFTALFDPDGLDDTPSSIYSKQRGKEVPLASDRETWYAVRSNALFRLGRMKACYEVSREALEKFRNFHHNNDLWFARRMALAALAMGHLDEAIEKLEEVAKGKREWYVLRELALLYDKKGKKEQALNLAAEAALSRGKTEFKVGLFKTLGDLLESTGEKDDAKAHYALAFAIRKESGWKIDGELFSKVEGIENATVESLLKRLRPLWRNITGQKIQNGKVIKVLHRNERGADGFLRAEGKEVYFSIPSSHQLYEKVEVGAKFPFLEVSGRNGKTRAKVLTTT